jgi:glutamate transport system permease protein
MQPPPRARRRISEDAQSFLGALIVIGLLPFVFGMVPVRGLLTALLPGGLWPALGLGQSDVEALQGAIANFRPFADLSTWRFMGLGLAMTVGVSAVSIVLSLPLATITALGRLSARPWLRWPTIAGVEAVRAFPVLILIFYVFTQFSRVAEASNLQWLRSNNVTLSVIVALTLYTTVVNAETIRAGILSLDKGQTEAARSLGLSYGQSMWLIILPQTFRRVLPPLIAQFVTLVKDTSLGAIVGLLELYHRGQILYQFNRNPMETFLVIATIYFLLNYGLGQLAQAIERRVTGSRRVAGRALAPRGEPASGGRALRVGDEL